MRVCCMLWCVNSFAARPDNDLASESMARWKAFAAVKKKGGTEDGSSSASMARPVAVDGSFDVGARPVPSQCLPASLALLVLLPLRSSR
jgi:hypothetical protein